MAGRVGGKGKTDVTMPYSFTDMVKALHELIGLVQDMGTLVGDGIKLYDRHRAKAAAKNLSVLEFTPHGSRKYLERIAAGEGTQADFDGVAKQMTDTAEGVEDNIHKLEAYRDRFRVKNGMAAAQKLNDIVYGPAGKRALRETLVRIADMGRRPDPPLEEMKAAAVEALAMIKKLNKDLAKLHDLVLKLDSKER